MGLDDSEPLQEENTAMKAEYRPVIVPAVLALGVLLRSDHGRADCLACSELKGVQIETKNGDSQKGYVSWNPAWFKERQHARFPEALLSPESWENDLPRTVRLYKTLYRIKHPLSILVTTNAGTVTLSLRDIRRIVPFPQEHDGYQGAGLPVLSQTAIRLLSQEEPYALFKDDSGPTDIYLISFKKGIDKEKLRHIRKSLRKITAETVSELEASLVILLSIPYD